MLSQGVDPEAYCFQVDGKGRPLDWLLSEFHDIFGVLPKRFLPNGYLPDAESAGHGALIVVEDPFRALESSLSRVYQSGIVLGKSVRKRRS
jgi:hypothetical protein